MRIVTNILNLGKKETKDQVTIKEKERKVIMRRQFGRKSNIDTVSSSFSQEDMM